MGQGLLRENLIVFKPGIASKQYLSLSSVRGHRGCSCLAVGSLRLPWNGQDNLSPSLP